MRRGLDPDTALDVALSTVCGRNRYTTDPGPVIDELRRVAGDRADVLAQVAGRWAGFYRDQYTRVLCDALLELPGTAEWAELGRVRAAAPTHGAPLNPTTPRP